MSLVSQANQHTSDPREQVMWDFYVADFAKGIENAYQAAIKAGYAEDSAKNITLNGWFKERKAKLKRKDIFSKAERNLDRILDLPFEKQDGEVDAGVVRIIADVSKTVVTTLGKDEGYSTRSEVTGAGGKDLMTGLSDEQKAKLDSLLF